MMILSPAIEAEEARNTVSSDMAVGLEGAL
jgi:hypothetical protein